MWVRSLDREDPLEEGMAAQSSMLAWRIPWTEEEPGRLQSMGSQRVGTEKGLAWAGTGGRPGGYGSLASCWCLHGRHGVGRQGLCLKPPVQGAGQLAWSMLAH